MPEPQSTNTGPLAGLRVLELARILAGPWVGQTLADLGADVVKVESPEGDDTRGWGPPFVEGHDGEPLSAAYFHSCNRGKRSVIADFRTEDGQDLVRRLAQHADVVVENFKVGGLAKYGLDSASLRALKPALVYVSITGFGQNGPYADRAGYDFLIQGMAGPMSVTGDPTGQPTKTGYATADIFTGLYATVGILAALRRRDETGVGATLDMALMDSQVAVMANQAMNFLVSGTPPGRLGNAHPNIVPYEVFPTTDGHVIIAVGNDGQFQKLMGILGEPAHAMDARFSSNQARVENRAVLVPLVSALTARHARAPLLETLSAAAVPAGPINDLADVFKDPQVVARGLRVDLVAPDAAGGRIPTVRGAITIDGVPQTARRPSPQLGEHQRDVLQDPAWGGTTVP
jgi:crotonobetainyl-CoA:carnitine CoA-transferase CaiB-like acyl-CoA transferase